ncbi:hypothetical protein Tco_1367852 [Tanacetum coccineum]
MPANAILTGKDNPKAIKALPLSITEALRIDITPPLDSMPDKINARLHIINPFAITMEYTIPPVIAKSNEGICKFSKKWKAIKRTQKHVALAKMITNMFHICVWSMDLKIPINEGANAWIDFWMIFIVDSMGIENFVDLGDQRMMLRSGIDMENV